MRRLSFQSLSGLQGSSKGLTATQVQEQRNRYGGNYILEASPARVSEALKDAFRDPMIWFLIVIGALFFATGQKSEGVTLFISILPLMLMDAFLHWRTQSATTGLRKKLATRALVVRDGREFDIDSKDLVPGDLLKVSSGIFLPADGVFEEAQEIQIDESVLTGEAYPVQKVKYLSDPFKHAENVEVAIDENFIGFAGTRVLVGSGLLRIVSIGTSTSYGKIVQSVSQMPHELTPLQVSVGNLVKNLIYAATAFCVLLGLLRVYQGYGWLDAMLSSATLAIAAFPEEFPVVFTFFLGIGVFRLAQKKALVRRAVSVENIGRITNICTDKTGTITLGELKLCHIDFPSSCTKDEVLIVSALSSNTDGSDPVDCAILKNVLTEKLILPKISKKFPFTEARKRQSALVEMNGKYLIVSKGAPEALINLTDLGPEDKKVWIRQTEDWAKEGHKVLACAKKELSLAEFETGKEFSTGFQFMGLIIFEDPVRPEVVEAIKYANENKIKVCMLTGDHPQTAAAIGRDIGMGEGQLIVVSAELEPEKFVESYFTSHPGFLESIDIIARCTPEQKLQIVLALKKSGKIIAVTGDGINDVPALKAADIGIAMGIRGSQSAKEVSSIILSDDNFKTIVSAIKEGKQLFANLKTSFEYLLLIHIPFVLTAGMVPLLGYPMVYLPVHIVWLELIIHPTAILAFQSVASTTNNRSTVPFFNNTDILRIVIFGVGLSFVMVIVFLLSIHASLDLGLARAKIMIILSFWSATLVAYYTHLKSLASKLIVVGTLASSLMILFPSVSAILLVTRLSIDEWAMVLLINLVFISGIFIFDRLRIRS